MADVVYLVRDLLFTSKVREVAGQLGLSLQGCPDAEGLVAAARTAKLVIVDLRRDDAERALSLLRDDAMAATVAAIGFVDHARTDVVDRALSLGCREVLTKGEFSASLPSLLSSLAGKRAP